MYLKVVVNGGTTLGINVVSVIAMRAIQKSILDIEQEVLEQGEIQVARVIAEGDTQDARVISEGNNQVARAVTEVDKAEDYAGTSNAEALTSDSWANAPLDTDVIQYTWNQTTDTMDSAPIPNARSSAHWSEIARTSAAGLIFQAIWDSVDCSLPPTPVPNPGQLANGFFYIIGSVTGDSSLCPELSVGDWLIWSGDLDGDITVEGAWQLVNWTFSWAAISDVTVEGLPTAHGDNLASAGTSYTMTEQDATDEAQDALISDNTAKVGITTSQADEITANTLKVGITPEQAQDITDNNAKVGITVTQADEIDANTLKVGITTSQAQDITDNNAKTGITAQQTADISSNNTHRGTTTGNPHSVTAAEVGAEPALGNPGTDGQALLSTAAGVRSWGSAGNPLAVVSDIAVDTGSDRIINIVSLTNAEYDALTPVATTLYIVVG